MRHDPDLIKAFEANRAAISAAQSEARFRGAMRARLLKRECSSAYPERRAMLTAMVIVDERFPMLRQSSHFNDGADGFLASMERAKVRRAVEANICARLTAKYRRMMGAVPALKAVGL